MRHFRADYNRIQDPENKIGEDEPVFLIRAQDERMVPILTAYLSLAAKDGDWGLVFILTNAIRITNEWQATHETKPGDL